uniref:Uncharacterized protein n=1 Tax=Vespula pensylvanica TaxID=30213 RepID=A0A834U4E7_VESPE|nr:hypothetical protein H0235_011100 [Vespula pensylvanica]
MSLGTEHVINQWRKAGTKIAAKAVAEEYHEFQEEKENLQKISSGQGNILPFDIHEEHVRYDCAKKTKQLNLITSYNKLTIPAEKKTFITLNLYHNRMTGFVTERPKCLMIRPLIENLSFYKIRVEAIVYTHRPMGESSASHQWYAPT